MAISALAYAGTAFGQPAWTEAAAKTARVLLAQLRRPDGRWLRSWRPALAGAGQRDGKAGHLAYAGDYAWLVEAFTRLGEATGQSSWTSAASETARSLLELFWDKDAGGFFTYGNDAEELIARMKDLYDGATASANATAALALARLGELTGDDRLIDVASQTVNVMAPALSRAPAAFPGMALAASYLSSTRRQVVVTSIDKALVRPVWERFLPDTVLAWGEPYASPLWEGRQGQEQSDQAYVCQGYTCRLPLSEPDEVRALLDGRTS
jgi:uncharacterized protein